MKKSSFDHQSFEALRNKQLQSDTGLNNPHQQYVSLQISKSVHSRLFALLCKDQQDNALYNVDKFLHQILDKWEQEASEPNLPTVEAEPIPWRNRFQMTETQI